MSTLKSTIEDLAADFAMNIISALRSASIEELTGVGNVGRTSAPARASRPASPAAESAPARKSAATPAPRGRGGRLGRRSVADIEGMVDTIVSLLGRSPEGMRAEQIREALGVQAKELPRPLSDGLAAGKLRKSGQKRATTYFAAGGAKTAAGGAKKKSASKKG